MPLAVLDTKELPLVGTGPTPRRLRSTLLGSLPKFAYVVVAGGSKPDRLQRARHNANFCNLALFFNRRRIVLHQLRHRLLQVLQVLFLVAARV